MVRRVERFWQPSNDSPNRSRSQAAHLSHVAPKSCEVYVQFRDLLLEDIFGDSVEEDLDRQNDHGQVVDASENRDVVRDEVTTE